MDRRNASVLTAHLTKTDLFSLKPASDSHPVQNSTGSELAYLRAQAIARQYKLTADDVLNLTDKFWAMHMDNIIALDVGPMALLSIQYNLCAGTLAPWAAKRPELRPILQRVIDFEWSGQFMLTEQAHGLDAIHIETTATLRPDGSFDLHTPHDGAAKYMPPSVPLPGIKMPRVAVVIAKLLVDGEDRGVRPFVVALSDEKEMCKGVTSRRLPERPGASSIGHALTWFNHIRLPPSACLGSTDMPRNKKAAFQAAIWRVTVGALALSSMAAPAVGVSAYILARYSQRRTVVSSETGKLVPILSFATQHIPILHALAQSFVVHAFMQRETSRPFALFCDPEADIRVRMGVSAAAKCAMMSHIQDSCIQLSERTGAQGLYGYNQIIAMQLFLRGASIAEGDTMVLSIRLATELILNRYELPKPRYPTSLAAQHEIGLLAEARSILKSKLGGKHRSEEFDRLILPRCESLVRAIGERFFYEAALDAGVERTVLDLYEVTIMKHDPSWFAMNLSIGSWDVSEREDAAVSAALPLLENWLELSHGRDYALAPIVSNERWREFMSTFSTHTGTASPELLHDFKLARDHSRL